MKVPFYISLLGALLLVGCGNDQTKPVQGTNTAGSASDSGGGYLGALDRAQKRAVKTIDTASLDQAIQMFNVQEGRFPKDLNELVEKKVIGQIPAAPYGMKLDYDPATGKVSVVKQ